MSETTRKPETSVVPLVDTAQFSASIQMPLAEFAKQYNTQKPHADIARMEALFNLLPPKTSSRSSFEVFSIQAIADGAPVRLARAIDKNIDTGSELLDEGDSTTYYIFVGNTSELAFAQINQNSSKWGQINNINQIEELNDENLATVNKVLKILEQDTTVTVQKRQREHDAKVEKIKDVSIKVGTVVGGVALVGAVIGGAVVGVGAFISKGATDEREKVENFDNQWAERNLGTDYAPVDQLQKVSTVSPDDLLLKAPGFGAYDGSIAGPRSTTVGTSTCSTTSGVKISPTDKISVVTIEPTKTSPISYYADSANDKIIFCNFGGNTSSSRGSSSTTVYFDIHK